MKKLKWYAVPPYQNTEQWKIVNEDGEYVASFEMKEVCELVVKMWNDNVKKFE